LAQIHSLVQICFHLNRNFEFTFVMNQWLYDDMIWRSGQNDKTIYLKQDNFEKKIFFQSKTWKYLLRVSLCALRAMCIID